MKKRILVWSDCVLSTTGFGIVSHYILKALWESGKYDIDQLAINFFGSFYDKEKTPYCLIPSRLDDPRDPYGNKMFIEALKRKDYDYILIINDSFVVEEVGKFLPELRRNFASANRKFPTVVYYFPVDCRILSTGSSMIREADVAVAYSDFATEECKRNSLHSQVRIYHGVDTGDFYPLGDEERAVCRKRYFGATDKTFTICNINRNTTRKDIAKTLLAFAEFRKQVPDSVLYLHCKPQDSHAGRSPVDLRVPIAELGLNPTKDVLFPKEYSTAQGYPVRLLNQFYNASDVYLSTHLGEGFGLTILESMAAGTPVIVPDNTVMPELVGADESRGYMYPCLEKTYVDNSGYRKIGRLEDILATLFRAYEDWKAVDSPRISKRANALLFAHEHTWAQIGKEWVNLFEEVDTFRKQVVLTKELTGKVL